MILDIIEGLPIPQADRNHLKKQIDVVEMYQKTRHSGHYSLDTTCTTHCMAFALSDFNCAELLSKCEHVHKNVCPDCINIIKTLDEIEEKIREIFYKEA